MNTFSLTVEGLTKALTVVNALAERSQWFEFEPYPGDDYAIAVKVENRELLAKLVRS